MSDTPPMSTALGEGQRVSRSIVEDTAYWAAVEQRLNELADRRDQERKSEYEMSREAVPLLIELLDKLALVEEEDHIRIPMIGGCLDRHRALAHDVIISSLNESYDQDIAQGSAIGISGALRLRLIRNLAQILGPVANYDRKHPLYHLIYRDIQRHCATLSEKREISSPTTPFPPPAS